MTKLAGLTLALCPVCRTMQPFERDGLTLAFHASRGERCLGVGMLAAYPLWAPTEEAMQTEDRVVT